MKYKLADAWDLFWCYSSTCHTLDQEKGRWWVVSPAGPASPAHWPWTHMPRSFGRRLRGPLVWNANELPGKHPSVKALLEFRRWIFGFCALYCFSYSRSAAKTRAGEEPLKLDIQLTGMITRNHSHCLKMLNPGFFFLVLSSMHSSSLFLDTLITWTICLKPLPSTFSQGSVLVGVTI